MLHGQIGIMAVRPVFSGVADDVFAGEEKLIPFSVDKNNDGDVLFTTKYKVLSI